MLSELQPICLVMALLFSSVFVIAGVSKYRDTRRARNWVAATGRITESKVRSHRNRTSDGDSFESMPLVVYEYDVEGTKYRGTKINFAEKTSGEEIAPTLNKYPEGKIVSVYYNPANPNEAVLEKDFPQWAFTGVGAIIAVILLLGLAAPYMFEFASRGIETIAPKTDNAPLATLTCGMGVFTLFMAYAMQKQRWAMRRWPSATGKILDTSVQAREEWDGNHRYSTYYNSEVVYSFEVNSRQYISDRVNVGARYSGSMKGNVPGFVNSALKKYPKGSTVQVYYNPKNPTECVLESNPNGMVILLLLALGFIVFSASLLGVFQR